MISTLFGMPGAVPALLGMAWKGSLLVVVLLLTGQLARGAPAATRHLIWAGGLVALVGLPVLDAALSSGCGSTAPPAVGPSPLFDPRRGRYVEGVETAGFLRSILSSCTGDSSANP